MACGRGSSNLFNVRLDLLATNYWLGSGLLPLGSWAGQATDLFLGIAGGTSTNANISIRNIRFVGLPQPVLEVVQAGGNTVLTWAEAVPGLVLEFCADLNSPIGLPNSGATNHSGQWSTRQLLRQVRDTTEYELVDFQLKPRGISPAVKRSPRDGF